MPELKGFCEACGEPISAFVVAEDLRREGEAGFAAYFGIEDVTCSCGCVLGEKEVRDA